MPFHLVREMKNAHTAGKIDSPTTTRVAGPAKAQPVKDRRAARPRVVRGRDASGRCVRGVAANVSAMSLLQRVGRLFGRLVEGFLRGGRTLQHLGDAVAD